MHLTMTGEYAVRAMIHLATFPRGTVIQLSDIANEWRIPDTFLRKIAAQMTRAGLLISSRGVGGGVSLAKDPERLTVLDVIEAVEGKISLNKCLIGPHECGYSSWCDVHILWAEAQAKLKEVLQSKSLAELARRSVARKARKVS